MLEGLLLACLVLSVALEGTRGAVVLAGLSLLWLMANHEMEGDVLLTLSRGHGLTEADLAGLAGLSLAVWRLWDREARKTPSMPVR